MEPMNLGSPINSPVSSPVFPSSGTKPNSNYYPSFLLGDGHPSMKASPGGMSPGRAHKKPALGVGLPGSPQTLRNDILMHGKHDRMRGLVGDRPIGPPSAGLVGGLAPSPQPRTPGASFLDHSKLTGIDNSGIGSPGVYSPFLPNTSYTPMKDFRNQSDVIIESSQNNELIEPWVTIFGFPLSLTSYILGQFAQFGIIVDQKQSDTGNWMHVKYQSSSQARKALSKNGKIFGGDLMIGVVPCIEESVMAAKNTSILNESAIYTPADSSLTSTPKSNLRPLTQSYRASRAQIEVTPKISTPKKDDGLLSKTMQTLFGY